MFTKRKENNESTFECANCGYVWNSKKAQPCPKCKTPLSVVLNEPVKTSNNADEKHEFSQIGWGRSFLLALKSEIVGFLIASIWILIYIFIRYEVFIQYYAPYFGSEQIDWNWLTIDSILSVASPFISFRYTPYNYGPNSLPFQVDFPIFSVFTQEIITPGISRYFDVINTARLLISFLVYASFFVPIIKFSLSETNNYTSWLRSFVLGFKSAIVGIILSIVFFLLGILSIIAVAFGLSKAFPNTSAHFQPSLGMLIGIMILVFVIIALIAVFIYTATGATIIRYTTKEASTTKIGTGWGRSFLVALKASVMALLWTALFSIVFGIFSLFAIAGSVQSSSPEAFGASIIGILFFLIMVVILSEPSPTASIISHRRNS
jgi:hypothetical protein